MSDALPTRSALASGGSSGLKASTRTERFGMSRLPPNCAASQAEPLEPRAWSPEGGLPVRKRRRPTSWVSVSMLMPRTTARRLATASRGRAAGPSRISVPGANAGASWKRASACIS